MNAAWVALTFGFVVFLGYVGLALYAIANGLI